MYNLKLAISSVKKRHINQSVKNFILFLIEVINNLYTI
jgi:hypothetical protein